MDLKDVYLEIGEHYRIFVAWREKILAGYLTVLAAIGLGVAKTDRPSFQVALLGAAVIVSAAFWILDLRNRDFLACCQKAAKDLEDAAGHKGAYAALESLQTQTPALTLGLAVDLLVSFVAATAVGALASFVPRWFQPKAHLGPLVASGLAALVLLYFLQRLRRTRSRPRASGPDQDLRPPLLNEGSPNNDMQRTKPAQATELRR